MSQITHEIAQKAGACPEGLTWLQEHGPVELPDVESPAWRAWGVSRLPDEQVRPHLTALAADPAASVRYAVAVNASTPAEVRTALAADADQDVRCRRC